MTDVTTNKAWQIHEIMLKNKYHYFGGNGTGTAGLKIKCSTTEPKSLLDLELAIDPPAPQGEFCTL